jgi:hypothetical protein
MLNDTLCLSQENRKEFVQFLELQLLSSTLSGSKCVSRVRVEEIQEFSTDFLETNFGRDVQANFQ